MPHAYLKIETVYVKMWNCTEEPCLWGGTVQLLHQNDITWSLCTEDLLPTNPGSFSLQEGEGTQENRGSTHSTTSHRLNPTNSSVLPAGVEITPQRWLKRSAQSHCLKACPSLMPHPGIDLQEFSTLISCHVNLCNRNVRGSNRSHRMPTSHLFCQEYKV